MRWSVLPGIVAALCVLASELAPYGEPPDDVTISYTLPEQITLLEPVSLLITIVSVKADPVRMDLGVNDAGSFQLTVTKPDGTTTRIDPMVLLFHVSYHRDLRLTAGESAERELVLNDWVDFSTVGTYRLDAEFIGAVTSSGRKPVTLRRSSPTLSVRVLPRDERMLHQVAERLLDQMFTPIVEPAWLAAVKLAHLDDPLVVRYWAKFLDLHPTWPAAGFAIRDLECIGNEAAWDVIEKASRSPANSAQAYQALERRTRYPQVQAQSCSRPWSMAGRAWTPR